MVERVLKPNCRDLHDTAIHRFAPDGNQARSLRRMMVVNTKPWLNPHGHLFHDECLHRCYGAPMVPNA
jgi:hypothetical protein